MPLRDHFRPPLDNVSSWEELHGQWPAMIVLSLASMLPRRYVAVPRIHLGPFVEIDVAAFEKEEANGGLPEAANGSEGSAVATLWAPSRPTLAVATELPSLDEYEVRVYDTKRGRRLVAAVEIVSPANKDRPEHRRAFVAKCAALLQEQVSVTIVDLVTTRTTNLYAELLDLIGQSDPALSSGSSPLYAVACRATKPNGSWELQAWFHFMQIGEPLPTVPLWLADNFSIPLNLEEGYEAACKVLRMP